MDKKTGGRKRQKVIGSPSAVGDGHFGSDRIDIKVVAWAPDSSAVAVMFHYAISDREGRSRQGGHIAVVSADPASGSIRYVKISNWYMCMRFSPDGRALIMGNRFGDRIPLD